MNLSTFRPSRVLGLMPNQLAPWLARLEANTSTALRYIQQIGVTGSICPSTPFFAQRVANEVARMAPGFDQVVFAGVGSGVVARRVLKCVPAALFFECDPVFEEDFRRAHPRALLIADQIQRLYVHRPALREKKVLLVSLVPTARRYYSPEMVALFTNVCSAGGEVMQMRYLPHQMSARVFDELALSGVSGRRLFTEVLNVPPVSMFGLRSTLGG